MIDSNWMVRHAIIYRKFLTESVGMNKNELDAMNFSELSNAVKPYIKSPLYAPYKTQIYNLRG